MKYKNISVNIKYAYFLFMSIGLCVIFFAWLTNDSLIDNIVMTISLLTCMILFSILYFRFKQLWYKTYFLDSKIYQKFFKYEKEIEYSNIKYIFLIDNLLVLSSKNEFSLQSGEYTFSEKKKIKRKLKNNIIIWIGFYNKYLHNILKEECKNAQIIKMGKISKYIAGHFDN